MFNSFVKCFKTYKKSSGLYHWFAGDSPHVNNDGNTQNFQCPLGASGPSPPGNMSDFLKALDFSDEALLI